MKCDNWVVIVDSFINDETVRWLFAFQNRRTEIALRSLTEKINKNKSDSMNRNRKLNWEIEGIEIWEGGRGLRIGGFRLVSHGGRRWRELGIGIWDVKKVNKESERVWLGFIVWWDILIFDEVRSGVSSVSCYQR
jgi:hypothetical protein